MVDLEEVSLPGKKILNIGIQACVLAGVGGALGNECNSVQRKQTNEQRGRCSGRRSLQHQTMELIKHALSSGVARESRRTVTYFAAFEKAPGGSGATDVAPALHLAFGAKSLSCYFAAFEKGAK